MGGDRKKEVTTRRLGDIPACCTTSSPSTVVDRSLHKFIAFVVSVLKFSLGAIVVVFIVFSSLG